jgi:hypothetical protein
VPCMMKHTGSFTPPSLRFVCDPEIVSHMRILQSHGYLLLLNR